ncbi:MAG TPA: PEP/pyruvate-binding domain-containing protein [Solirubrobacteraceae bacterium]|nr:PEP/pyruvate-binding domain-containing protein [Solirubrobacteraceae bacterium]
MSRTRYTRSLDRLRREDESSFGGKSASLGELLAAEIPVPPGFALSTAAYSSFAADDTVAAAIAGGDSDAIGEAMRAAVMPATVAEQIADAYTALGEPPVAVRSSAVGEDSEEATFAGQQETFLWVRGVDQVRQAVRDCWISLYSPTAVSYRARLGRDREAAMGVTVQEMVDAEISGVMFTCNPVSGDPSMVAVNASWGLGLAVVGGEVTPDDYLVSKVTREVVRATVNDKHHEYVPDPNGRGAIRRDVEDERRSARCLDEPALAALVDVAKRVERHFGSRQDIEWAIARGTTAPEGLYLLQSRPVTGVEGPKSKPAPASAIAAVMNTFGANVKRT